MTLLCRSSWFLSSWTGSGSLIVEFRATDHGGNRGSFWFKQFWLKHFSQGSRCSRAVCRLLFCCGSVCSVVLSLSGAQCAMPKGWSKAPVLDGWVQIVREPRPKSERWPSAKKHGRAHPPGKPKSYSPHVPVRQPSRLPDQVAADAAEVHKLEAAVQVLGGENNVHAKPLVEALKAARAKSRVPPVSERSTSCRNFFERAKKRVTRAEDLIAKAWSRSQCHEGVAEAEEAEEVNATIRAWCDGVAENRGVCPRTRRIACPHAGSVVCRRPPVR